ncbi:MAG: cupin domain-containing protein [Gaiellaceae bacterium]
MADPTSTDPDKYEAVFENEQVRVLVYRDEPGQKTSPHEHPGSVMYTLSSFRRRLIDGAGRSREVAFEPGEVRWLAAQTHSGENTGDTPTHVLFVEVKGTETSAAGESLGPS